MGTTGFFEAFVLGDSFLHRADPRVKLLSVIGFACIVAISRSFLVLLVALLFAYSLTRLARLDSTDVSRRLFVVNGFMLILWLVLPFSYPGTPWFSLGPLTVTHDGIRYALQISLRANAVLLVILALLATTPIFQLGHALRSLRAPSKLVHILLFCYRYISVIEQEYRRLYNAMRVRGFRPRTSLHTYRSYAYLVGMLLVRSYERSQRVYEAMLCRGFRGEYPVYQQLQMAWQDWVLLAVMTVSLVGLSLLARVV